MATEIHIVLFGHGVGFVYLFFDRLPFDEYECWWVLVSVVCLIVDLFYLNNESFIVFNSAAWFIQNEYIHQPLKLLLKAWLYPEAKSTSDVDSVPRGIWLKILRALTRNTINTRSNSRSILSLTEDVYLSPPNAACWIYQQSIILQDSIQQNKQSRLGEQDFNMVLLAFAIYHDLMTPAHRIVTPHVTYSILCKAYGRIGDIDNLERSLGHVARIWVKPDIVMANTLLDPRSCWWKMTYNNPVWTHHTKSID